MAARIARHALVVAVALVPAVRLGYGLAHDALGANPIETITHTTGDWALRLLLVSLAITPLRRISGWNHLIAYRRTVGLLAFTYAVLHFSTWLVFDHYFDLPAMVEDIAERPYITAGATAFACLLPLAVTSTRAWVRRLGGRTWARVHKLAYVAAVAAVVHYWWLVKSDVSAPLYYAAVLTLLLAMRLPIRRA